MLVWVWESGNPLGLGPRERLFESDHPDQIIMEGQTMYDVIYGNSEVESIILQKYPQAKIKDASDFIHTERFECEIPDVDEDSFYPFALKEGFARLCFGFEVTLQSLSFKPDHDKAKASLDKWIELAKIRDIE